MIRFHELLRLLWNNLSRDYDKYMIDRSSAYPEARDY